MGDRSRSERELPAVEGGWGLLPTTEGSLIPPPSPLQPLPCAWDPHPAMGLPWDPHPAGGQPENPHPDMRLSWDPHPAIGLCWDPHPAAGLFWDPHPAVGQPQDPHPAIGLPWDPQPAKEPARGHNKAASQDVLSVSSVCVCVAGGDTRTPRGRFGGPLEDRGRRFPARPPGGAALRVAA